MKRHILQWIAAGLVGLTCMLGGASVQAQEYWRSYPSPYYSGYRAYYGASPVYSSYYYGAPAYYSSYYRSYPVQPYYYGVTPGYYSSYYAPSYSYGRYYGAPNAGYYASPYGGGQVQVGRMRIGWR